MRRYQSVFQLVGRLSLGLIFLAAGLVKIGSPAPLALAIENYRLVPSSLVSAVAIILPLLEIVVGLELILGIFTRAAAFAAGLLSSAFGLAVLSALVRGLDIECGCFSGGARVSWIHFALNLVVLGVSCLLVRSGGGVYSLEHRLSMRERFSTPLLALLLLATVGGATLTSGTSEIHQPASTFSPLPDSTILFHPQRMHLGEVIQGEEVEAKVRVQNASQVELKILDVGKTCGCTHVSLDRESLTSGGWAELSLRYRSDDPVGHYRVFVALKIEGLEEPVTYPIDVTIVAPAEDS
jgi:uncharacterized membrane protein YphA (DoxX/SURF4 family)